MTDILYRTASLRVQRHSLQNLPVESSFSTCCSFCTLKGLFCIQFIHPNILNSTSELYQIFYSHFSPESKKQKLFILSFSISFIVLDKKIFSFDKRQLTSNVEFSKPRLGATYYLKSVILFKKIL